MTDFTIQPKNIRIKSQIKMLSTYRFGSKTAKHHFCSKCGIFTFVQTRLNPGDYRINLGCVDDVDIFNLPVVTFDGNSI